MDEQAEVYTVLEDDGTEVDEEEYFQLLPERSVLMVLSAEQIWSPNFSLQGYGKTKSCYFFQFPFCSEVAFLTLPQMFSQLDN